MRVRIPKVWLMVCWCDAHFRRCNSLKGYNSSSGGRGWGTVNMPVKSDLWSKSLTVKSRQPHPSISSLSWPSSRCSPLLPEALVARSTSGQVPKVISTVLHLCYCRLQVGIDRCSVGIFQRSFLRGDCSFLCGWCSSHSLSCKLSYLPRVAFWNEIIWFTSLENSSQLTPS